MMVCQCPECRAYDTECDRLRTETETHKKALQFYAVDTARLRSENAELRALVRYAIPHVSDTSWMKNVNAILAKTAKESE